MAQIPPLSFQFPPIRYSPIQEAFRGALDTAFAQFVSQPFEEMASRRAERKQEAFELFNIREAPEKAKALAAGEIQTGRVSTVTDPSDVRLLRDAGIAPKYKNFNNTGIDYFDPADIARAHQPANPALVGMIETARKSAGFPAWSSPPQYEWQAEQLAKEAGVYESYAQMAQQQHQFDSLQEERTLTTLISPPDALAMQQQWAIKDPKTGRPTLLSANDSAVLAAGPGLQALAVMPFAQKGRVHDLIQRYATRLAELRPGAPDSPLVAKSWLGINREDAMKLKATLASSTPSEGQAGELQAYAALASQFHLLRKADGSLFLPRQDNPGYASVETQVAFHQNQDVQEATIAWNQYRTRDMFNAAKSVGLWVPINPNVLKMLDDMWTAAPGGVAPGTRLGTGAPLPGTPNAGWQAGWVTPDSAKKVAAAQAQLTPTVAGQAAPNVEFKGTDVQRAVFQNGYARMTADPGWYGRVTAQMDSLIRAPMAQQVDMIRGWTTSPALKLDAATRSGALAVFAHLDSLPNDSPEKKTKMRDLIHLFQDALSAARDAALNPENK